MERLWLISYDVACPRRRRQVDALLLPLGQRVLETLFECWLGAEQARHLHTQLQQTLCLQTDRMAMVPVCGHCQKQVLDLGLGHPTCPAGHVHTPMPENLTILTPQPAPPATQPAHSSRKGRPRPRAWFV